MAALLGRRLCGSALQPAPVGLQFLPRLKHTHAQHSPAKPFKLSEIQQKKEELFDLLVNEESLTFRNSRLMNHLSVQIKRRPDDPQLSGVRIERRLNQAVEMAGVCTFAIALYGFWRVRSKIRHCKDGEKALGVKNKQDCKRVEDNDLLI